MRINVYFIKVSQFLQQFCLVVRYKLGKEYIISDALSRLANANHARHNNLYFEVNTLFTYFAILMEISSDLIKHILNSYLANNRWVKI